MKSNKLIIASAGSGKTTLLVKQAFDALKNGKSNVLITTYTISNKEEIKKKIYEINKCIPENITVQTWFSFLLQHGVKPYQGCLYEKRIKGLLLVNSQSAVRFKNKKGIKICYGEEDDFEKYYFTVNQNIYSDKLSKFVFRCNEKSNGLVIDRLSRIYSHIYIDEVQDLAGWDLDLIKLLFKSKANILLVGDPRQVTYLTHHDKKYKDYKDGKIEQFIVDKCKKDSVEIDLDILKYSHRNNSHICRFSSKLYPNYPESKPCYCDYCRENTTSHSGIYLIQNKDVLKYILKYKPAILRYNKSSDFEWNYGESKGLTFDRVLIYPTKSIVEYLRNGMLTKTSIKNGKKIIANTFDIAKFYVAVTRAKHSVGIVVDFKKETYIDGIIKYNINEI